MSALIARKSRATPHFVALRRLPDNSALRTAFASGKKACEEDFPSRFWGHSGTFWPNPWVASNRSAAPGSGSGMRRLRIDAPGGFPEFWPVNLFALPKLEVEGSWGLPHCRAYPGVMLILPGHPPEGTPR